MGFFSSRKAEPTPLSASEESSVKVIRSRFYGKNKSTSGRPPSILSAPAPLPAVPVRREAPVFSQSPPSSGRQVSADALTMSLAQRLNELAVANADKLLNDEEYRLLRQNLFERFSAGSDIPTETSVVPIIGTRVKAADSYRHVTRRPSVESQRSIASAVSSLFRRATGRSSSSLASQNHSTSGSVGGSVFSLQQQLVPAQDTSSLCSRPSFSSGPPRSAHYSRSISRQRSDDSLMSTSQAGSASGSVTSDLRGIMSRHRIFGSNSGHYASSVSSRATTRSAKPPSSFHLRQPISSPLIPPRTHEDDEDDHPKSAAELREEIQNVETEGRKLLDAFNGLELTALTKSRVVGFATPPPNGNPTTHRLTIYSESTSTFSTAGSSNILIPERTTSIRKQSHSQLHALPLVSRPINLKRKPSVVNSIAGSFKSSTSDLRSGFMSSVAPSLHSSHSSPNLHAAPDPPPPVPALPISVSTPSSILNKKRPSIMRQQRQLAHPTTNASREPPQAAHVSRPSPLSKRPSVPPDPSLHALETELADIRQRKADVSLRYERRLDFLRAKLKSAEIRERLIKK